MPEGSIPGGPGRTIVALLAVFGAGGSLGMIYRIVRQRTIRENKVALSASVAVLLGFIGTLLGYLPLGVFLWLLGGSSLAVVIVGLEQREDS